jgi:hypothetical protein
MGGAMAAPKTPPGYPYTPKEIADLSGAPYQRVLAWGLDGSLPCVESEGGRRRYPREAIAKARKLAAAEERTSIEAAAREWTAFEDGVQAIESALAAARTAVSILETVLRRFRAVHPGVAVTLETLPAPCVLKAPVGVIVYPSKRGFAATFAEADLTVKAMRRQDAIAALRELIVATYQRLRAAKERSEDEEELLRVLSAVVSIPRNRPKKRKRHA